MAKKPPPRRRGYDIGGSVDYDPNAPRISGSSMGDSISNSFSNTMSSATKGKRIYDQLSKAGRSKDDPNAPVPSRYNQTMAMNDDLTSGVYARGGKIRHTAGPKIGKDDGLIPAQKGEFVIRKSAVKKLGSKVLGQVNRGKLPTHRGR